LSVLVLVWPGRGQLVLEQLLVALQWLPWELEQAVLELVWLERVLGQARAMEVAVELAVAVQVAPLRVVPV
jgi:hypothetical protein